MLDEVMTGLKPHEMEEMMGLVLKLKETKTIMVVEHVMKVVMGISDRIIVLDHGVKIAEGTPTEVNNPKVMKLIWEGVLRNMLKIENLNVAYGDTQVLWDLSLHVKENEIVTLLGPMVPVKHFVTHDMWFSFTISGSIIFQGKNLLDIKPYHRPENGVFGS